MHPDTLRIAFATPEYVTENHFDGGLANYVHRVARALADRGHEVHVLTLSEIDDSDFEHAGVKIHRLQSGKVWRQLNRLTRYRLATTLYLLDLSFQVYRRLRLLNRERPFDLVQFPNYSCCGLCSIWFLPVPHVLRASWYQSETTRADGKEKSLDSRMMARLERLQHRWSPHIFAPSKLVQGMLAKEDKLKRVRVIPTPIYLETEEKDCSVYERFLKEKQYLLFFGRLEFQKGFGVVADALPRVLAQYPDACFAFVGRDMGFTATLSMADHARTLCNGFAERLIFIDQLPHSQLYPVIAGARLVVLPSLMDNFPNACLEAMCLGKPVVGTLGASFDELITDEETGFLVAANDAEALAEKICYAWAHPKLREIGEAAQRMTLAFAPEKTVELLLSYYDEILRGAPAVTEQTVA